jgi:hypothetical protein
MPIAGLGRKKVLENYTFLTPGVRTEIPNVYAGAKGIDFQGVSNISKSCKTHTETPRFSSTYVEVLIILGASSSLI